MSPFEQLLDMLSRDGVKEIVLQSGARPCARVGAELKPVSQQELGTAQIHKLVQGTALGPLLPIADEPGKTASFELGDRLFVTKLTRFGDRIQVRIARSGARPAETRPERASSGADDAISSRSGAALARTDREEAARKHSSRMLAAVTAAQPSPELSTLLRQARARGASDVHLSSDRPAMMRVAGRLVAVGDPIEHEVVARMVFSVLEVRHRESIASAGYADLSAEIGGAGRLRVNVSRHRAGIKGCFRLVRDQPATLAELGMPRELEKITLYHQGLVVVSGPSGQGKSTTLAALVHLFNASRPVHIITVEDPVEIVHPVLRAVVSQREVGVHTKSFQSALKGSLREDPDIIVIGELRDRETVEMALSAAETGHLVIATMSTPSAARTIDRIIDMFPPDDQAQVRATLAGALKLVIAQKLVPHVDGEQLVAAVELVTGTLPLWTLIRDSKLFQLPSLMQRGRSWGMIRFDDSLNDLVSRGVVSLDVARSVADDPRLIGGATRQAADAVAKPAEPRQAGGLKGLFGRKE